jgi:hypothetical protein
MKKILTVTVATEVKVEGAVQPGADQPYLLLRPLWAHQYNAPQKTAPAAAPSSTHLRSQVLSVMVLYTT